ncbi:hypothetical protein BABINDRAFT_161168 [Babjeviella inositovora NRRL Y-12698]|uniref:Small-subunit processome Utp12 domain-containing protein n=1 Tax=Babjeviella inositovora NRRL Y-12698 TaxID=984486 RepID=A0A1E3QRS9_9ASCO|nr:uncharacterized protein BABINDRAFT_161168 [Babjeviella inositovora NRRL Y-12698]ODQ80194.1 hypothetical protein BABINDRAFT_161168 [Babjeviella inositovora NRRL Y-12698]
MSENGPLLSAVFDPSGSHLASAIVALDAHKVRVQSTQPGNSALAHAFALDKGSKLTSVSWGALSLSGGQKKQKTAAIEHQMVAIGLNKGHILLYSPTQNEVVAKLETPQGTSITDFHHSELTGTGWSVDITGTIIEWDLLTFKMKQKLTLVQDNEIKTVQTIIHANAPHLLVASHSVYLVDPRAPEEAIATFPGHVSPVHTILPVNDNLFFTAAMGDRFINLYSIAKRATQTVFVAQSNVVAISFVEFDGHSVLAAVTEDGLVEVFTDALVSAEVSNKRRNARGVQSRSANATIKLQRPSGDKVAINSVVNLDSQIVVAWLEEASIPYFERINWLTTEDNQTVLLLGDVMLEKSRPSMKPTDHSLFGHDVAAPKHYNEGNAVVTSGDNFKDLENESEEEAEEAESLAERLQKLNVEPKKKKKAQTGSLTVVLSQALKANDHTLLETVLNNRDATIIKNTIRRLDSALAVVLLNRLADKVSRQSTRQGQLNVWIKWIMVLHGGYMVSLPNLAQTLASLYATLHRRSAMLNKLMELQNHLNMLHSQVSLRRDILGRATGVENPNDVEGDSDVEYNEEWDDAREENLIDDGEEDFDSMDEIDMEQDDYSVEEGSSDGEEDDDTNINSMLDLEAEEGDSDVEVGVDYGLEEEEEEEDELAHIKNAKSRR